MKRQFLVISVLLVALLMLAACGAPAAAPPADESAPPETAEEEPAVEDPTPPGLSESEDNDPPAEDTTGEDAEPPADDDSGPPEAEAEAGLSGEQTYRIITPESPVRFYVDEVLSGEDTRVLGETTGASGQIIVNYDDPAASMVENLTVDITGLATDNSFRNRAIHDMILQTGRDANGTVTFEQTAISGLPLTIEVGQTVNFQLTGDLTIQGTTNSVTFDVTATPVSETRLEGTATADILYSEFGVNIPRLPPQVASVGDTATLEIAFTATAE